jgi:hypothetical protein
MNEITLHDIKNAIQFATEAISEIDSLHSSSPELIDAIKHLKTERATLERILYAYERRTKVAKKPVSKT